MNTVTKMSVIIAVCLLSITVAGIVSCNSRFPPSAPQTGSYGDSLWQIRHFITNERAGQLIANFRSNKDGIISGRYNGNARVLFDHETFNLRDISELIKTKGCIGLRINMGMDENNQVRLVLIGVDQNGRELIINGPEGGRSGVGGADVPPPAGSSYVEVGQRHP